MKHTVRNNKKEKKAGAIILDSTKQYILLVKGKYSQKWGTPKGTAESDESMYITANREVYEETGLQLNIDKYEIPAKFGRYYLYVKIINRDIHQTLCPVDTNEISDIAWVLLDDIDLLSDYTVLLKKVLYYIKTSKLQNSSRA